MDTSEVSVFVESSSHKRTDERVKKRSRSIQDSFTRSIDFQTYIPWQTLSSDLSDKLKQGSVIINRSNIVEWATIKEENERTPLMSQLKRKFHGSVSAPHSESSGEESDKSKESLTESFRGVGASWTAAVFLLVNAALGAGLLNYPVAYDRLGGLTMSSFIQVIILLMLGSTMLIMVHCSDLNKDNSYHDVLLSMCGKKLQQLSAASIMTTCFGINISFLMIIGDQYDRIFASYIGPQFCEQWYFDRKFTILLTALVCIWPMCYFKRLDFLRYASTLGIFAMLYVVFLNVYEYYNLEVKNPGTIKTHPTSIVNVFAALPVICFAYQTHEIVIPTYACMAERNIKTFTRVVSVALFILFIIYCVSGSFGYLTFGTNVASDIMQMYNAKDPVVLIGILALVVKMITTYAPVMFCGRGAIDGLYAEFSKISTENFIRGEFKRRMIITTVWNIVVLLLSMVTPNITIAIEILGSLASCNVFVFPGLCMVAYAKRLYSNRSSIVFSKVLYVYGVIVILTGALIFCIVLLQVVDDLRNLNETHQLCILSNNTIIVST